jgi:hypothetical protein
VGGVSPPTEAPIPMTLGEAVVALEPARSLLTERQQRALEVLTRLARRTRASGASQVNMVTDLIAARDAQRAALDALERAIGTASTAPEMPAERG